MNLERHVGEKTISIVGSAVTTGMYDYMAKSEVPIYFDNRPVSTFALFLVIATLIYVTQRIFPDKSSR